MKLRRFLSGMTMGFSFVLAMVVGAHSPMDGNIKTINLSLKKLEPIGSTPDPDMDNPAPKELKLPTSKQENYQKYVIDAAHDFHDHNG